MYLTIALILSLVGLVYWYLVYNFQYWKKRGVPGPRPLPLVGTFPGSFFQKKTLTDEVDVLYKKYIGTTPFVGVYSGRKPSLLLLDNKLVKDVLITKFKHFHDNEFSDLIDEYDDSILSKNPFLLTGEKWKEKRAEITPAFTNQRLKSMFPSIVDVAEKLHKYLLLEIEKKSPDGLDSKELAAKYTTDVVSSCIYGIDSKSFTEEKSLIREMGSSFFSASPKILIYFLLVQLFPIVRKLYRMPLVSEKVENFYRNLINDAIRLREEETVQRDDFLNYLLQLRQKKNISDLEMAAHTITFFLDGFETSSVVISSMLYRLAGNKDVQTKLRTEINENLKNGELDFDTINDMVYLDQVFNETLRIDPPGGFLSKLCTEPMSLTDYKDKSFTIDSKIVAIIPIYSIHRDPEHYPDPQVFDPDRFSAENGGVKPYKDKGVFLAFGDGPRICLGMKFATMQSKVAVVKIIKNFELDINPKTKEPFVYDPKNFLLCPLGGIWLDIKSL